MKPEEFREWNEKMVKKYDPEAFHHHHNPFIRFIESKRARSIIKNLDIQEDDRIIEIGCGAGDIIEKSPSGELFGTDISPSILLKAKHRLNQKANLFLSDAQNLPCKDQIFTKVICSEVLEHILDPASALNEIARILKIRGIAIISIPNEWLINRMKSVFIRLGIFKWLFQKKGDYQEMPERMEEEWHLHTFNLEEWLTLFERKFKATRLIKIPFPGLPLRYVVRLEKIE
jgi:ubiquinone/menaquinone biosynthesis C-methylase UbiE